MKYPDRDPTLPPTPRQPTVSPPTVSPTPGPRARRRAVRVRERLRWQAGLPIALALVVLLAAGAYGLTTLLGSSGPKASTIAGASPSPPAGTPAGPSVPSASTTAIRPARPVHWLGMQIETVSPGTVVIDTVARGSQGELAGLEPGDVIVAINHRPINATDDIGAAIQGLRAGDVVTMQISRGSTRFDTQATPAAPTSVFP